MSYENISILLGSLRYKSAPNVDFSLKVPFYQNNKEIIEFERNIDVNLEQVYFDERQKSTKFRPTSKFQIIFKNSYSGYTDYKPFRNNLYYLDSQNNAKLSCENGVDNVNWVGLPQYNEFDFIRTDNNLPGYTQQPNQHLIFESESASTYNWNFFLSYPYSSTTAQTMQVFFKDDPSTVFTWNCSDGLPFIIKRTVIGGNKLISFKCPVKHGLYLNDFVELSISYDSKNIFKIYSFGLEEYGNEEFVFNLYDVGYTGNTFDDLTKGTFKRVIDDQNVEATKSNYYVKKHKILTDVNDAVLVKAGFELNIFGKKSKYESSAYTPNKISRISTKEDSKSYTLTFNTDLDINGLLDNQKRPLTEIFYTVLWKGYFGWTNGLKKGWNFNLPLNPTTNLPNSWWANPNSNTNFTINTWNNPPNTETFKYVESLKKGDVIDGDYCEWNSVSQNERVISNLFYKFTFNPLVFNNSNTDFGYYYQTHYPLTIRVFSNYIETGTRAEVEGIPDYAQFSKLNNEFLWRDIYEYGYFDESNRGVNYPFLNGQHYPYKDITFRIIPEGSNYTEINVIFEPIIDFCE
jgi:hypothetical protein